MKSTELLEDDVANAGCMLFLLPTSAASTLLELICSVSALGSLRCTCRRARRLFPYNLIRSLDLSGRSSVVSTLQLAPSTLLHLKLQFCNAGLGNGRALSGLLSRFTSLQSLNLDGCSELHPQYLSGIGSVHLVKVSFYWVPKLTDAFVTDLVESSPNLIHVNLSGARLLTNAAVAQLSRLKKMRFLNLTKLVKLTDIALLSLSKSPSASFLEELNFYAVPNFTNVGIKILARTCSRLSNVDLCGSQFLTDDAIASIAVSCPLLTHFNLTWCVLLTDKSLFAIGQHSRNLTSLQLLGIASLTDAGLEAIALGCPKIRVLDVNGCPLIKRNSTDIISLFPRLTALTKL